MKLRTLHDLDPKGKRVLLRVDFNVPTDDEGYITDATRIREAVPTIKYLVKKGARVIVMSHMGRPRGKVADDLRLDKVAQKLVQVIKMPVKKVHECIGEGVKYMVRLMKDGEILMLENTRFYHGEEINDREFTKQIAKLGDVFVSDAFGTVHRAHATTVGLADFLPSYAGLLLEREIKVLSTLLEAPKRPVVMIMGGAKIDTKIGILKNFIGKADAFLIGGCLANTFLHAIGHNVGKSLCEFDKAEIARKIIMLAEKNKKKFVLPSDSIVASEPSEVAKTACVSVNDIEGDMKIFDIGEKTIGKFCEIIKKAGTVIWNGPVGLYEYSPFEKGTYKIAEAVANCKGITIIGGGDTIDAIGKFGISKEQFTHISTGGGVMIEFLEGKELPGIKVLKK